MGFYRAVRVNEAAPLALRPEPDRIVIEWRVIRPGCRLEESASVGTSTGCTTVRDTAMELTNGVARVYLSATAGTRFHRLRCD